MFGQTEIHLCMFADDMTMFLYNLESVKVVKLFEEFYRYADLKFKKKKPKKKKQKLLHYKLLIAYQIICLESNI